MDSTLIIPSLPDEQLYRFVAVLNEKVGIGQLLNALGHMTAGLSSKLQPEERCLLTYQDASGGIHPCISHYPFIVLKAENSNQIQKLRLALIEHSLPYTDFVRTMTVGTSAAQLSATAAVAEEAHEYFGVATFGATEILKPLTKRFSLFARRVHSTFERIERK